MGVSHHSGKTKAGIIGQMSSQIEAPRTVKAAQQLDEFELE